MKAGAPEFVMLVAFLCLLRSSQFVQGQVAAVQSFSIEESMFSCSEIGGNLKCAKNATTPTDGSLKLTPDPRPGTENYTYYGGTLGVALYIKPVQVLNRSSNQAASLSINFSFRIEYEPEYGPGDGLAFVMFSEENWVGSAGENLGAFDSGRAGTVVKILAVEFDTYENPGIDDNDNHVGVDTTSTKSEQAKQLPFLLRDASRVYAWIDYHPESLLLEVRVSSFPSRPDQALISYNRNLLDLLVDNVWVGFSGSNGNLYSFYTVYNLNFQSTFLSIPPPSISPDPVPSPGSNSTQESNSKTSNSGLIAGVTVGVAGVVVGVCSLLFCARRKREVDTRLLDLPGADGSSTAAAAREFEILGALPRSLGAYSYAQLCAATDNFNDALKLGEGGFGSVYRGSIPAAEGASNPELLVAVKKIRSDSRQGEREFVSEVSTIGMLRHRNIIQLLGWCSESEGNYLLVYEYMPKGSLDRHLYPRAMKPDAAAAGQKFEFFLTWKERMKILRGIAAAIHYLHEGWRQQVIHRDVKSSNVMLDNDLNAMLGDFGLARMSDHFQKPATTCVAGTYGYIAPEVPMTGKYTVKSDVFAFGAVCLEVVCGRKVYDENTYQDGDEILLVDHVWRKLSEDKLLSVVDRRLENVHEVQEVEAVLLLGLLCSHPKPSERPTMHMVLEILAGSVELPAIPKTKPEGEYYAFPYQNKEKRLFLSDSGRRISSDENGFQTNSALSSNSTRSGSTLSNMRPSQTSSSSGG
ncbi:hypothetical protein R1flu_005267 [Riccia fluitans]|uniref:non-specific serine/threonine protein kinase n=1 Tax=Riccia fluitans TaxID=41844 RepID=A0ABD1YTA3_9MARC